jgi:hypothetical protein
LVNHFSPQFDSNPELKYWLKQGWDAYSIIFNVCITILALYLGSIFKKESIEENQHIDAYFKDLKTPIESQKKVEISIVKISNLKVIGVATSLFGIFIMVTGFAMMIFSAGVKGPGVTIGTGIFLFLLGIGLYLVSLRANEK